MIKNVLLINKMKAQLLLLAVVLSTVSVSGATYTALATGNWGSSATWVGNVAPSFALSTDLVVIPNGIMVTMDNNVSVTGAAASVEVAGTLASGSGMTLSVANLGTLSGAGSVNIGTLDLQSGANMLFTGTSNVITMNNAVTNLQLGATVTVGQMLNLMAGTLSVQTGGSVNIGTGGTIQVSGGALATSGGTLGLALPYNVLYSGSSVTSGLEVSGSGLNNLTINVGSGNSVSLAFNISVAGTLSISTGSALNIGGDTLTLAGDLSGSGAISTNSGSGLIINTNGGLTGSLTLAGANIGTLAVNVGAGNTVSVSSNLVVKDALNLQSGTLSLNGYNLTLEGSVSGSGNIASIASSNITITTNGGTGGALNFAPASRANNVSIAVGTGSQAKIGGNLDIMGALNLDSGIFNFGAADLIISGTVNGAGLLSGSNSSNLTVNTTGGLPWGLNFAPGGQLVNGLLVNVGAANVVTLASNLQVAGNLNLAGGSNLNISNYGLTVDSNFTGTGSFIANDSSVLVFNDSSNIISDIRILGDTIGTLTIFVGVGDSATLGNNLTIIKALNITTGTLNLNGFNFTMDGIVSGEGNLSSNALSNIAINTPGGTTGEVIFTLSSSCNNLIINVGSGAQAIIAGEIAIDGTLFLTSGTLNFTGIDLTIGGQISGPGSISGSGSANLYVFSPGGLQMPLNFAPGGQVIGSVTINVGPGNSVSLGTNLAVGGIFTIVNGSNFKFSGYDLSIAGNLFGTGTFTANDSSTLALSWPGSLTALVTVLGPGIGTLTLNIGNGNQAHLGDSLTVTNSLNLLSGALNLNNNNLRVTGNITNGDSGTVTSNGASNITISTGTPVTGTLVFTAGGDSVGNLSVKTGGNLMVGSNVTIVDSLVLNGGTINVGNDTLNIAGGGSISGASSMAYVVASGSGALALQLSTLDTGWVQFPIGTRRNFAPVALQVNAGSTSGTVYATVDSAVYAQGTTGLSLTDTLPLVNVTWLVEPAFSSHVNLNLKTTWSNELQVNGFNDDSAAYISHYTNGAWDVSSLAVATAQTSGMFSLERHGLTSFSPFTVFGKAPVIDTPTAINNVTNSAEFELFPNPASDNIIIKNIAGNGNMNMDIMDITGQIVGRYKLTDYTTNLSLTGLASGDYFVKLYNDNVTVVKTFIKM